jgi:hypothetical protein
MLNMLKNVEAIAEALVHVLHALEPVAVRLVLFVLALIELGHLLLNAVVPAGAH